MLERTDSITNEVLEPIMFDLAYTTVFHYKFKVSTTTSKENL